MINVVLGFALLVTGLLAGWAIGYRRCLSACTPRGHRRGDRTPRLKLSHTGSLGNVRSTPHGRAENAAASFPSDHQQQRASGEVPAPQLSRTRTRLEVLP